MNPETIRFVLTPFRPVHEPALGVSVLLSVLKQHGYAADATYLNVDYADRIEVDLYDFVTGFSQISMLGEVLFARALWGRYAAPWEDYVDHLRDVLRKLRLRMIPIRGEWESVMGLFEESLPRLERMYEDVNPALVEEWAEGLLIDQPRVLGFSSSFQQNVASLALARAVRRRRSPAEVTIVFGGANCEDDMGQAIADNFSYVDRVVSGEAEATIVRLAHEILKERSSRQDEERGAPPVLGHNPSRFTVGKRPETIEELPLPNFGDYFAAVARTERVTVTHLIAESARGCWWGEKSQCTFCGLNGNGMAFRSKSPARVVRELRELAGRHGIRRFVMTDNILDTRRLQRVVPLLRDAELEIFYEIKSNLRREQVLAMASAGIRWVQPGIESLDSEVLRLINKGCTKLKNIQLIKWCLEAGVKPMWSILYGFPGESAEALLGMAELCGLLAHLPAPMHAAPFQMHRFSPYHRNAESYGLTRVRAHSAYAYAYPCLPPLQRDRLAYVFDFHKVGSAVPEAVERRLLEATATWMRAFRRGARLSLVDIPRGSFVHDSRVREPGELSPISSSERALLLHLGETRQLDGLADWMTQPSKRADQSRTADTLDAALSRFRERGWVIEERGRILGLVTDPTWADSARAASRHRSVCGSVL